MNDIKGFDSKTILSNRVNFSEAERKGLIKNRDCINYSVVQGLYLKGFESLLLSKVDLKKYDDMLKNSDLDFQIMPEEQKFIYHKLSYMNLSYIYIRNFFFIEKLGEQDLSVLIKKISNKDFSIDQDLLDVVSRTYSDVMIDNFRTNKYIDSNTIICYGPHSEINDCPADSLCVYIHYNGGAANLSGDAYQENKDKKKELLDKISKEMEELISKYLNVKVTVKPRKVFAA